MKTPEKILEKSARKNMVQWSQSSFKMSHPKLYRTIIEAIKEALRTDINIEHCPNCGSGAVGYDGRDDFFECFQCDHNWIP